MPASTEKGRKALRYLLSKQLVFFERSLKINGPMCTIGTNAFLLLTLYMSLLSPLNPYTVTLALGSLIMSSVTLGEYSAISLKVWMVTLNSWRGTFGQLGHFFSPSNAFQQPKQQM